MARLTIAGRTVLHDGARQLLFELNETADLIWQGLTSAAGESGTIDGLVQHGLARTQAEADVRQSAQTWLIGGQMAPRSAIRVLSQPPDEWRRLVLDELSVDVAFHGVPAAACDLLVRPFAGPGEPAHRLAIVAHDGLFLFFLNGEIRGACPADGLAPQLKATLTQLYVEGVEGAFLSHGALLSRQGFNLFLSGPPGAGKSTLALALAGAGWAFAGDDIVRIGADGQARAVGFAACVKSGAWPLLERTWPELARLAVWTRPDGQSVRYLMPPAPAVTVAGALHGFVVLARQAGAPATLHEISPVEALQTLLDGGYSARWSLTGEALAALAAQMERARCRRLVYSDLAQAVQALEVVRVGPA